MNRKDTKSAKEEWHFLPSPLGGQGGFFLYVFAVRSKV